MRHLHVPKFWTPTIDRELGARRRSASVWDDIRELAARDAQPWKSQMHELWLNGDPVAVAGGLAGLESNGPSVDQTAVTVNASEVGMWPAATFTPISIMRQSPTLWMLRAYGVATSAATPGTQTFNPRIGTTSAGITLGVSSNLTPTASETAVVWTIDGVLAAPRSGGASSQATATGYFEYRQTTGTSGNAAILSGLPLIFGGSSGNWDNTVAQALFMGLLAATSTTNTMTTRLVLWGSWN